MAFLSAERAKRQEVHEAPLRVDTPESAAASANGGSDGQDDIDDLEEQELRERVSPFKAASKSFVYCPLC